MKKLMLYPYNKKVCEIVRQSSLMDEYEISAAVVPQGYGCEGKDIACLDGGDIAGIAVTERFEENLDRCDSILFVQSTYVPELDFYLKKIKFAEQKGKEVLITRELKYELNRENTYFKPDIRVLGGNAVKAEDFNPSKKYLKEIAVPVVILFSMGEFCGGLGLELKLIDKLKRDGYKVSSFSSTGHADLFGIHMLPDYLYESNGSLEDKIVSFNWYAEQIVSQENTDLLVIEVKEPIMAYSDRLLNQLGTIPYIVSNAVKPDVGILNLYYGSSDENYYKNLRDTGKFKFDIEIEYFNIANTKININEFDGLSPVSYLPADRCDVMTLINDLRSNLGLTLFHSMDEEGTEEAYRKILDELAENPPVVSIW